VTERLSVSMFSRRPALSRGSSRLKRRPRILARLANPAKATDNSAVVRRRSDSLRFHTFAVAPERSEPSATPNRANRQRRGGSACRQIAEPGSYRTPGLVAGWHPLPSERASGSSETRRELASNPPTHPSSLVLAASGSYNVGQS
jgi:hypothetical protein